jgi:hypothetical protein
MMREVEEDKDESDKECGGEEGKLRGEVDEVW